FSELIGELVRIKSKIIVTVSVPAALAAKNATTETPIVFIASDPLGSGLVPSIARPGGTLTVLSISPDEDFSVKWLELLKEAVPKLARVAILLNPANPANAAYLTVLRGAAQRLGVKLQSAEVRDPSEFDGAFASMSADRAQALVVVVDPLTVRYRARISELAAKNRLPAMYVAGVCGRRGADGLRAQCRRPVSPRGRLRGQDSQGRQACRPPDPATHQVRVGHQSEGCEGTRDHDPAIAAGASGSGCP